MKISHNILLTTLLLAGWGAAAAESADQQALIKRGEYLAVAADCGACHRQTSEDGAPFAGGYAIDSPMGRIIASNITPSKQYGIGNYSEQQFADALRKGVAADGSNLYPAMPYTAYQGMTDQDVHALYSYFMHGVKPVESAPSARTELSFPFNIRQIMWGWNLLYRNDKPFARQAELSEQLNRGKYLVDVLAHCSTCHTPRNLMMAEDSSRYLSGSPLGGWYAPNITPDNSGIGDWSQGDIAAYLKTGHLAGKAQAAGPMAEAVEHSFRYLGDDDLNAIAAWMKHIPAINTPQASRSAAPPAVDINQVVSGQGDQASLADSHSTHGAELYNGACASCHGLEGQGTRDNFYPSLTHNSAVSAATAQNLVMTIVDGIHRKGSDSDVGMPAFGQQLNDAQIAAVTQYVRRHFAGIDQNISAEQVTTLRNGGEAPFIVRYINYLIAAGVIVAIIILLLIVRMRRK
ncbi:D-sorbitol dehydrogenase (acceptor) [Erwinia toletana]|uniref:D-sorbitol dehydrogenase (Acceptor) n=1 Tax=Winslowiella toletana TaxID=92490 RepID=A0ABS4P861_9GAMM|nr:c-type cytochrome [Winslowiella toletana]MBP2168833.1 D-sorbitol dehydrogenase (acceptor) [Winslowiella toletana]